MQNVNSVIIPGGMTNILQSLDESINKPMKCLLWKKWNDWMLNADRSFTKSEPAKTRIVNSVPDASLIVGMSCQPKSSPTPSRDVESLTRWTAPGTTSYGKKKCQLKKA